MVSLCDDLQREFLDMLQQQHPENKQFEQDLAHIRRKVVPSEENLAAKELRLRAEQRVRLFVLEKGERIGHGDLLNRVKKWHDLLVECATLIVVSY